MVWFVVFVVLLWVFSIFRTKGQAQLEEASSLQDLRTEFVERKTTGACAFYVAANSVALAQAENGKTWAFRDGESEGIELNYDTLLGAEVLEDGSTVVQASRGRQLGAAAVGGMIAGNVGALIGGLGAKQKSRTTVSSVTLRLTLANFQTPLFDLIVMNSWTGPVNVDGWAYKKAAADSAEWCARMEIAMRQPADFVQLEESTVAPIVVEDRVGELQKVELPVLATVAPIVADRVGELQKWVALKEAGHIDDTEFLAQKKRILES